MLNNTNNKKVLILGSKGMLGQALVREFERGGDYEVTGWDREEIDITDAAGTEQKIKALEPSVIINAAAHNAVDKIEESEEEFERAKQINSEAPGNLARIAAQIGAVLVHYSSDYVFSGNPSGGAEGVGGCNFDCAACPMSQSEEVAENDKKEILFSGYKEEDIPNPISRYGLSKLWGEISVRRENGTCYIIRLSKLFGTSGISEAAKKSFFDTMLELGKKHGEVKVINDEVSNFTYAPDLAGATRKLIESNSNYGTYHITNQGSVTWYQAARDLFKLANRNVKVIPITAGDFPRPAQRPAKSVLLNTKLEPLRDYREALKEYLDKIKESVSN